MKVIEFTGDFNSHAHVERDNQCVKNQSYGRISTHTLTWSVTFRADIHDRKLCHFNSHAHVERDSLHRFNTLLY